MIQYVTTLNAQSALLRIGINFGAGKTTLYSDFDGTYMVYDHGKCCKNSGFEGDEVEKAKFNAIYGQFKKFLDHHPEHFQFVVTTGRNKGEFAYFIRKLGEQGLSLPLPDRLITKNGGDVFYLSGKGMPYQEVDVAKREEIQKNSGWNAALVQSKITKIFKDAGFTLVTSSPSNNHMGEYGDNSLEYKIKGLAHKGKEAYVSFRHDGALQCHIAFPEGTPGNVLADKIKESLAKDKINAEVTYIPKDDFDAVIPHYEKNYTHDSDYKLKPGQSIVVIPRIEKSPYQEDGPLNKLYDVRKTLKQVLDNKSHDLVVVSGNGSNDESMLNPFNYVDLIGLKKPKDEVEKQQLLKDPDYLKKLQSLSFAAVIVGDESSLDSLRKLATQLNTAGVKKIISVDGFKHTLLEAVQEAISGFANQDRFFAEAAGFLESKPPQKSEHQLASGNVLNKVA